MSDRIRIHEVISAHGHLVDEGQLDRLTEVFTAEVRYDVTAIGGGVLEGCEAVAAAGRALGDGNPLAHHVTNVVVTSLDADTATARSKGLGVMADGTVGSVLYEDHLSRTEDGWRISERRVLPRRHPLQPSDQADAERP